VQQRDQDGVVGKTHGLAPIGQRLYLHIQLRGHKSTGVLGRFFEEGLGSGERKTVGIHFSEFRHYLPGGALRDDPGAGRLAPDPAMLLKNSPDRRKMIGIVLQDKTHPLAIMQDELQERGNRRLLRSRVVHTEKDTAKRVGNTAKSTGRGRDGEK